MSGTAMEIGRPMEILLVEDSPSDAELTIEALREGGDFNHLHLVQDGEQALAFLRHEGEFSSAPRPDLILLDLNLPKKDGREVLGEIKSDADLKVIPVVVLTTSKDESDVVAAYGRYANCYLTKPVDLDQFIETVKSVDGFWLKLVRLPSK
ncbi:MAG TPA: response regulator [Planctomycetaceae bacterium]|nr:response regulator [Planctomycetaceae bacterium]